MQCGPSIIGDRLLVNYPAAALVHRERIASQPVSMLKLEASVSATSGAFCYCY